MPDFTVPYQCPVTKRFWDAGRAVDEFDGEAPDMDKVRLVLGLPEIDGDTGAGFTDVVVDQAYGVFVEWLEGKEHGVETGLSSPSPTASPPASAPAKCCP